MLFLAIALREARSRCIGLLLTGTCGVPEGVVTELKTMPQIRSTQTAGIPVCKAGFMELVAHGMVNQSVTQFVSMMLPTGDMLLPVMLNDIAGTVIARKIITRSWISVIAQAENCY